MRLTRPSDRAAADATRAQLTAANRLKDAFAALMKDAKAARMYQGLQADQISNRDRFQAAFLGGLRDALAELPMIMVEVTPDALFFGDAVVLEGSERRGDMLEVLFAEGLRTLSIEAGASDDELLTMARILLTPWHEHTASEPDLATTAWQADFAHVYFEVVDSLSDREDEDHGESPVVRELLGLIKEINLRAAGDDDVARMRQDEFAVLLKLQDHVQFGGGEAEDVAGIEATISPALAAEVRAIRDNADLDRADVAGLLTACLAYCPEPRRARVVGEAVFSYLVNALASGSAAEHLVHRVHELLDEELTPALPHRDTVREAAAIMGQEPLRSRLGRMFAALEPKQASGTAFSLFALLPGEDDAIALAEVLPLWAVRVLADTVLLRAAPEPRTAIEVSKRFCHATETGSILLGLSMVARQGDPRLIESALAHVKNERDEVREAALVALRAQQTPRVREAVRKALSDPAEGVRMEAMRYAVAYRDAEVATALEVRLCNGALGELGAIEVRALCIAYARLVPDRAEPLLGDFALGRRVPTHPELPRLVLHGLRAAGTGTARSLVEKVTRTVPALAEEAQDLLTHWGRA
ncbi:MAG: HEAT repeat domain-containing protein [Deltaproteobacteria bacterium]|nr:HEAT repeat domain-containing protein [Deltaproteobacteria bacterium]